MSCCPRRASNAAKQTNTAAAAFGGLTDLVTTLAGVPGKNAVVYVTDGLPQRPGLSILDYLGKAITYLATHSSRSLSGPLRAKRETIHNGNLPVSC